MVLPKKDHESLNRGWEALLLALIGEELEDYNVIGIVLSLRYSTNVIEVWLRDRRDVDQ